MRHLDRLVRELDLNRNDRLEFYKAYRNGNVPPPLKPIIPRALSNSIEDSSPLEAAPTTSNGYQPNGDDTPQSSEAQRSNDSRESKDTLIEDDDTLMEDVGNRTASNATVLITCNVCLESLEPTAFPKRQTTTACDHNPDVCLQCLSHSITAQFENKMWDQIDCPSCGQRLGFLDVKAFAEPAVFERQESTMWNIWMPQLTCVN